MLVSMLGCAGDDPAPVAGCVTGQVVACPCIGGDGGTQVCTNVGTFGPCQCAPADAGVADAGAADAGAADAGVADAGAGTDDSNSNGEDAAES